MSDYGRRIVVDSAFEPTVGELCRAMHDEGLQVISRLDVRDYFRRHAGADFRCYLLLEAWSPDLALEAFRYSLEAGTMLPTTFAVYELADGETAIVANEPFAAVIEERGWRQEAPLLAGVADCENARVARVLARLQPRGRQEARISPAA